MEEDNTSIKSCTQSTKIGSREEDPYKNLLSILANCVIGKSHEWAMQHAQTWVNFVKNFNFQKYGSSASGAEFGRKVAEDIDHLSRSLGSPAFGTMFARQGGYKMLLEPIGEGSSPYTRRGWLWSALLTSICRRPHLLPLPSGATAFLSPPSIHVAL
jgi:hypothetical protein